MDRARVSSVRADSAPPLTRPATPASADEAVVLITLSTLARRDDDQQPAGSVSPAAAPSAMRSRASLRPDACNWCISTASANRRRQVTTGPPNADPLLLSIQSDPSAQIGRAACRERG